MMLFDPNYLDSIIIGTALVGVVGGTFFLIWRKSRELEQERKRRESELRDWRATEQGRRSSRPAPQPWSARISDRLPSEIGRKEVRNDDDYLYQPIIYPEGVNPVDPVLTADTFFGSDDCCSAPDISSDSGGYCGDSGSYSCDSGNYDSGSYDSGSYDSGSYDSGDCDSSSW